MISLLFLINIIDNILKTFIILIIQILLCQTCHIILNIYILLLFNITIDIHFIYIMLMSCIDIGLK